MTPRCPHGPRHCPPSPWFSADVSLLDSAGRLPQASACRAGASAPAADRLVGSVRHVGLSSCPAGCSPDFSESPLRCPPNPHPHTASDLQTPRSAQRLLGVSPALSSSHSHLGVPPGAQALQGPPHSAEPRGHPVPNVRQEGRVWSHVMRHLSTGGGLPAKLPNLCAS